MTAVLKRSVDGIPLHGADAFAQMRKAGALAAATLDMITAHVKPGVTTERLDQLCHDFIRDHNAVPAPLNYKGFPKSICTSINHVVCHGIPGPKPLKKGDILNIDVTVILDGWFGDTSRMFFVGDKVSVKAARLCDVTYDCLMAGIEAVKPGARLGDIGHAIQTVAHAAGYSVVRDFCGHGIGQVFHDVPSVMHFGKQGQGALLEAGMLFTIEPMINTGDYSTKILQDGWTAVTRDKSLSAQCEHTIGVTDDGYEIFTLSAAGYKKPPYG